MPVQSVRSVSQQITQRFDHCSRSENTTGGTSYDGGSILDPQTGKTYKLKGKLADGGKKLELRGFIGVAALGSTNHGFVQLKHVFHPLQLKSYCTGYKKTCSSEQVFYLYFFKFNLKHDKPLHQNPQ